MLGDVAKREIVTEEGSEQDRAGRQRRNERGNEGVACRLAEPLATPVGCVAADEHRIDDEPQRNDECGSTEAGHLSSTYGAVVSLAAYFDGHFVTRESFLPDEDTVLELAAKEHMLADSERVGRRARIDDGHLGRAVEVLQPEPQAAVVRIARDRSDDDACELHLTRLPCQLARSERRRGSTGKACVEKEDRKDCGN